MSRSSPPVGTFLSIPLTDGSFAFGRALEWASVAFYDYRSKAPTPSLDAIEQAPILFIATVRISGVKRWARIGARPLVGKVAEPYLHYRQSFFDHLECVIFDSIGNERPATPEECVGLEQSAVWEAEGMEERLLDRFEGRPNAAELRSRVRLEPRGAQRGPDDD